MKRKTSAPHLIVVISIAVLAVFCGLAESAGDGDQDAQGRIKNVEATLTRTKIRNPRNIDIPARKITVVVKGSTSSGNLWLGCTVTWLGEDIDLPVQTVRSERSGDEKEFTVKFKRLLAGVVEEDGRVKEVPPSEPAYYSVALWRWKVYRRDCKKGERNGPCEYCKKNGYHMEDRIDRSSGIAKLPIKSL